MIDDSGMIDRVVWKGGIAGSELESEYLKADLFVFPSLYETYGMALMEAAGYGLPVVTSVGATIRRTIPEAGALFFPPGDAEELREILSDLMSNTESYSSLCRRARHQKIETPTWNQCAERFSEILAEIGSSS
jgi:glycosyltransferase involved in cell wall biosynthesis